MDASQPSKTADLVAAARAVHMIRYDAPILEDHLAGKLCGDGWRRIFRSRFLTWLMLSVVLRDIYPLAPLVPARGRYCEDIVDQLVEQGVDQYAIIGAGHDSYAMRRPNLREKLTIFELDQPGTQNEKRRRMAEFDIPEPENVRYIDADLNEVGLFTALKNHGFDTSKRSVFSWFGVTYYLPLDTVTRTLKNVAENAASGSEILFDYRVPLTSVPPEWHKAHRKIAEFVAKKGEPFVTEFNEDELNRVILDCGLASVDFPDVDEIYKQYFSKLPPKARLTPTFRLCRAIC